MKHFCTIEITTCITFDFSTENFQGGQLIVGNLGDSRAVLCTRDRDQLIPVQLTVDLKPDIPSRSWFWLQFPSITSPSSIEFNQLLFFNFSQVKPQELLTVKEEFLQQKKNQMCTEYGCLMMTALD